MYVYIYIFWRGCGSIREGGLHCAGLSPIAEVKGFLLCVFCENSCVSFFFLSLSIVCRLHYARHLLSHFAIYNKRLLLYIYMHYATTV